MSHESVMKTKKLRDGARGAVKCPDSPSNCRRAFRKCHERSSTTQISSMEAPGGFMKFPEVSFTFPRDFTGHRGTIAVDYNDDRELKIPRLARDAKYTKLNCAVVNLTIFLVHRSIRKIKQTQTTNIWNKLLPSPNDAQAYGLSTSEITGYIG